MAPPAAAPMGGSGSAEEKKKAFEMAKQVRLGCSRAAVAAAGSKRVRGFCRRWSIASSCLGSA
jgi:hypothetical protein